MTSLANVIERYMCTHKSEVLGLCCPALSLSGNTQFNTILRRMYLCTKGRMLAATVLESERDLVLLVLNGDLVV